MTTIVSASFAGYYEHKSSVVPSGLEKFALWTIGVEFLHLVPDEELTEENADEFMDQLLQNGLATSYYISELQRCDLNAELYSRLTQLEDLCHWSAYDGMIAGEWQVISKMTNKTWKKEALEELVSHSKDDFEKIGHLLEDGKSDESGQTILHL